MIKRILATFLLILMLIVPSSVFYGAANDATFDIIASSALLIEKNTGTILFEHNRDEVRPADGLTRVMTLLLASQAVESGAIDEFSIVPMAEGAWEPLDERSRTLGIEPGERVAFIDLMYASFLGNAHEASNMIAIIIAGSIESFIAMMNDKANDLGCTNTRFVNTHGRYNTAQTTTAYDQYLIFKEAVNSELFLEISGTFRHTTLSIDEIPSRTITSGNHMINQASRYYYRHCLSGAESATFEGGHSLVAFSRDEGLALISVVLGSGERMFDDGTVDLQNFSETIRLLNWGYDNFAWRNILRETDLLARVPILHGAGADFVNARPIETITLLLNNSVTDESFIRTINLYYDDENPLVAPVEAGHILGEVTLSRHGTQYARMPVVANTSVALSNFEFIRIQVVDLLSTTWARNIMIILGVLVLIYLALVIRYHVLRAARMKKVKAAKDKLIREHRDNNRQ